MGHTVVDMCDCDDNHTVVATGSSSLSLTVHNISACPTKSKLYGNQVLVVR